MAADVYVCHTAEDKAIAQKVCEFLETQGLRCWIAPRNVLLGEEVSEAISSGIRESAVVVLVFSQGANVSKSLCEEVALAVQLEKVLIPLRIENVAPTGVMEGYLRHRYCHNAYTPPLERHLEEMSRMIRPLTQQRRTMTHDEASLSRTLPSRSSILKAEGSNMAAGQESPGPLQVSFDLGQVIATGRPAPCLCRVENTSSTLLDDVVIEVESRVLKRAVTAAVGSLPPGETHVRRLEMELAQSGNFPMHVVVHWTESEVHMTSTGVRMLSVEAAPSSAELFRRTQDLSALAARPQPAADPAFLGSAATTDARISGNLPGNFEPMELVFESRVGVPAQARAERDRPLQIPPEFLPAARLGTLLTLTAVGAPGEMPFQDLRFVARSSFGLGRSQDESDFLLWFWPRNEIHDTKTRRISKKHCTLTAAKGKLYVANTAAASLTTFDGQDLVGPEGVALENRGVLNLSGIYLLDVRRSLPVYPQGPDVSNLGAWAGEQLPLAEGGPTARGAVRFTPITANVLPQSAVWLFTDATFGTSNVNPIVVTTDGLAEVQGRFHHFRGAFWLESVTDNGAVQVDGRDLAPGFIVPLANGQTVKLGGQSYTVNVSP